MPEKQSKGGRLVAGLGEALDARGAGRDSENQRLHRALDDLLAQLERDSQARSQEAGSSQARFAAELDRRILGDEESAVDDLYRAQFERQLPSERQAFMLSTADGDSRDELANLAMVRRGQAGSAGARRVEPAPMPRDDSAGFERDFAKDQATRARLTEMFGSRRSVPEAEKQRILAEMAKGANATVAALSGPPATAGAMERKPSPELNIPIPEYPTGPTPPTPTPPNIPGLDAAARRERGFR